MTEAVSLPAGFEALEPFAAAWAVEGSAKRLQRRLESEAPERLAFYEAAKELVVPALAYLDGKRLDHFTARERCLMNMMLTLAHIAMAVEVQREDEAKHAQLRKYIRIIHTPADREYS
jgi:hypothetical protein